MMCLTIRYINMSPFLSPLKGESIALLMLNTSSIKFYSSTIFPPGIINELLDKTMCISNGNTYIQTKKPLLEPGKVN